MLYVLQLALFLIVIFSFSLFRRNILSPTYVLSAGLLFCNTFSIIGNFSWGQNVSLISVLTIIIMVMAILLGEVFAGGKGFNRQSFNEGNYAEKIKYVYNKKIFVLLTAFQMVLVYLYHRRLYQMASELGTVNGIGALMYYVRIATILLEKKIGAFFSIFGNVSQAFCYYCLFLLFANYSGRGIIKYCRKNIVLFIPILLNLYSTLISAARNGFITFFVVLICCFFFTQLKSKGKIPIKKIMIVGLVSLCLFFAIFSIAGNLTNKMNSSNAFGEITRYIGSSIVGFDVWFTGDWTPNLTGEESFWGISHFFHLLFDSVNETSEYLDGVKFPNGQGTNIYTAFKSFISDYSFIGSFIICFFIGFFYKKLLNVTLKKITPIRTVLFGYLSYFYIYMLFTPSVTSAIGTSSQITTLFWIVVIGFLLFTRKRKADRYSINKYHQMPTVCDEQ